MVFFEKGHKAKARTVAKIWSSQNSNADTLVRLQLMYFVLSHLENDKVTPSLVDISDYFCQGALD